MVPAVDAPVDAIFSTTTDDRPRPARAVPHGRVHDVRVARLELEVDRAGAVGEKEDSLPGRTTVARPVAAPSRPDGKRIPDDGRVYEVGVGRMNDDGADLARVAQPNDSPAPSCVRGFVDPLANGDVTANGLRARADVDDVGIGVGDVERADGC